MGAMDKQIQSGSVRGFSYRSNAVAIFHTLASDTSGLPSTASNNARENPNGGTSAAVESGKDVYYWFCALRRHK
jgi:hypothetical protein